MTKDICRECETQALCMEKGCVPITEPLPSLSQYFVKLQDNRPGDIILVPTGLTPFDPVPGAR